MCVALPLLVQNAPGDVFMKLFEPTTEYKRGNRVKAEIKEFQKLCRNISIKKSLAEKFLKKKFSGNISLIAPVVDTLAGLCQPCVQINRTQFPSFNINPLFPRPSTPSLSFLTINIIIIILVSQIR